MGSVPHAQGLHTCPALGVLFPDDPLMVETKILKVYIDLLHFPVLLREKRAWKRKFYEAL